MKYSPLPALILIVALLSGFAAKAVLTAEMDSTMICESADSPACQLSGLKLSAH
ncbi:hypothetical protein [Methylophaga lonarensis]|uniref:hypothetical protein n=1 Tax=Methylophaga lonarensis TaxID=999151 RepID=UPI000346C88D|nr:hypothetical protein [Methylophaga lonarensis]